MKRIGPLELIAAHRWQRATVTSYSLSAAFAEAVLIEALIRQGVQEIVILVDPLGYRMALRERGAVRIGREYIVHPVAVQKGCFHPKALVLEAADATHMLVGSANLTFSGWSDNLECIDHIHANGMALAIGQAGRFFAGLADTPHCQHEAQEHCHALAARLAAAAQAGHDNGRIRLVHTLDGPILEQLTRAATELGGARRVTVASPYWDSDAVNGLCDQLELAHCHAHVPSVRVPAPPGMDWPRGNGRVAPVEIKALVDDDPGHGLHAKLIEVVCAGGRVILSGSANATRAGLLCGGVSLRNVELCTLRTDLRTNGQWKLKPTKVPPRPTAQLDPEDANAPEAGILVAAHGGDGITGRILTAWPGSRAQATLEVSRSLVVLGQIAISFDRTFHIPLGQIEDELSFEGRVQLHLEQNGACAEGFVSTPGFASIRRRVGGAIGAMLAILKNIHAPDDVLAFMEYLRVNPEGLRAPLTITVRRSTGTGERDDSVIDPERVGRVGVTRQSLEEQRKADEDQLDWQRFMARMMQMTRTVQPPTEEAEDEEDRAERMQRRRAAKANGRLIQRFPQVFDGLLVRVGSDVELINLLRATQFVCVTCAHPLTRVFLQRLLATGERLALGEVARANLAWCVVYLAADGTIATPALARAQMLRLGLDPSGPLDSAQGFAALGELLAGPDADLDGVAAAIAAVRTIHDEVRALEAGLAEGILCTDLAALQSLSSWGALRAECGRPADKRRISFVDRAVKACPRCNITLLPYLALSLARSGLCQTACHGFILARYP